MREYKRMNNCTFAPNIIMNPRLLILICLIIPGTILAQTAYNFKIATDRMLFHDIALKAEECITAASATDDSDRQLLFLRMSQIWLTLAEHHGTLGPDLGREYRRLAELQGEIIPTLH